MIVDPIRKILPYTTILVIIVAVYVAYTFYSRKTEADRIEQQSAEKKAEQDRDSVSRMGGTSLKITNFYSNPGAVAKGQSAQLCYGAVNAKTLTLDPPVEHVWPSLSRCFPVTPQNHHQLHPYSTRRSRRHVYQNGHSHCPIKPLT